MPEVDPAEKFPEMQPVSGSPTLFTWNGCGLRLFGERNRDEQTGVYVKTLGISLLFAPVLFLRSYLVADAEDGGWYFLGRMPLSDRARLWNTVVSGLVFSIVAVTAWNGYSGSPEVVAGRNLAQAEEHAAAGNVPAAAALWAEVAEGGSLKAPEAEAQLAAAVDRAIEQEKPAALTALVDEILSMVAEGPRQRLSQELFNRGLPLVEARVETEPIASLKLFDALAPLAPEGVDLVPARRDLLERIVVLLPEDPRPASDLATMLEAAGETEGLEALLAPHADRLGSLEGARILAGIYAEAGRLDDTRALLLPYARERLAILKRVEAEYDELTAAAWHEAYEALQNGQADDTWYRAHRLVDEEKQAEMVFEWVGERVSRNLELEAAAARIREAATVVPVALDLGTLLVQGAYSLTGEERVQELETAQQIFLGIRSFAQEDDEYRLSLGQVYYWLGKPEEGKELFEQVLEATGRHPGTLISVGNLLRAVGAESSARELAEEAYGQEPTADAEGEAEALRYRAAHLRALVSVDLEDRLRWYRLCDPADLEIQASLETSEGDLAVQAGRPRKAADHLRRAIDVYEKMPESAASLNNGALVYSRLFEVTGDREAFRRGAERMEQALALVPGDRMVIGNTASFLERSAVLDMVGDAVDFATLESGVDTGLLRFLFQDAEGQAQIRGRFTAHPSTLKARDLLERVLVMAPNDPQSYLSLPPLVNGAADEVETLRALVDRAAGAKLDVESHLVVARTYWTGEKDAERREQYAAQIEQSREVVERARRKGGATTAVARSYLVAQMMTGRTYGLEVSADEVVRLAEEAVAAAPSRASDSLLQSALLFRASENLARASPEWSELLRTAHRALSSTDLVPLALAAESPWSEELAADPDVTRALDLALEQMDLFPRQVSVWIWALLRSPHPRAAESLNAWLADDAATRLDVQLDGKMYPYSGSSVLRLYWLKLMDGEPEAARRVLDDAVALGMPLPMELVGEAG